MIESRPRFRDLPRLVTDEDHWLWWARCGYVQGKTSVEEFERAVENALHGRPVTLDGRPDDASVF